MDAEGRANPAAAGKPRAWYTAFYYLAEHLRIVSDGAMNHKKLYALVGAERHFVDHANPLVRKRTAGTLSRIIHSKAYAADMRERYARDNRTFMRAAAKAAAVIVDATSLADADLADYLEHVCWPDVRGGLANEKAEARPDLNLSRIDSEMSLLFARATDAPTCLLSEFALASAQEAPGEEGREAVRGDGREAAREDGWEAVREGDRAATPRGGGKTADERAGEPDGEQVRAAAREADQEPAQEETQENAQMRLREISSIMPASVAMLEAQLHVIAFGALDFIFAHELMDETPAAVSGPADHPQLGEIRKACLVKYADADHTTMLDYWVVPTTRPFTIGRFTDCDALEVDTAVSRMHCCLYCRQGTWYFEDLGSKNGSCAYDRDGRVLYDRASGSPHEPVEIEEGTSLVLAGGSFYWFGSIAGERAGDGTDDRPSADAAEEDARRRADESGRSPDGAE